MGCQVSSDGSQFERSDYDKLWKRMNSVSDPYAAPNTGNNKKKKQKQTGWKIMRVVLVTTYKDFRNERRAVLDLVRDLRLEVLGNRIEISGGEQIAINSKECAGYIIDHTFTDESFLRQHAISSEQSYSEVFLQLAGLQNPSSIFLYRNPSFHQELPFNVTNFIDSPVNRERAKYLTSMVKGAVAPFKFIEYSVRTSGINNTHFKHIMFDDLSGAIKPIEDLITKKLDSLPDIESTSIPTTDDFMRDYYADMQLDQDLLTKLESNIRSRKSTLLVGEYCTGKTAILQRIQRKYGESVLIQAKEKMSAAELRREIESKTKVILHDVEHKLVRYLLVDDIHLATKEAQQFLVGNEELVIIATSRKRKIDVEMDRLVIQHPDPEEILDQLSFWLNGGTKEKTGVPSVKASNILKMSQQKRRRSLGNVEDGHQPDENIGWNSLKCRVIGTLGRLGSSDEKCAQLSQLSTLR
ncbi:hypothetical protein B9Z55_014701 [Caenorhabditis nigoni]|uniref:Uncharacterized protein n=1 Tax=Caenorhabditis nigoni TaxID=1611254 RepID=A0A2G5U6Z1_9PELO|nr:hypothetical protein B9Z55_014701 [Caenorhabditis nigoni]